jgi:hypothetical protein
VRGTSVWAVLWMAATLGCGGTAGTGLLGRVTQEGQPVQGALVFLTESPTASVQTDAEGRFTLAAPAGRHELTARYVAEDGALNEQRLVAEAGADAAVELQLPRPTRLEQPTAATRDSAQVAWNPYPGSDFREYKLYRHTSAALDESTGTLVHVGMARGEAQFVDTEVRPGETYYYRVFVMNDFGRLAGSNIARLAMPNVDLVQGGDFEADGVGQAPPTFTVAADQSWTVSDARAHSGTHALRGSGDYSMNPGITQRIPGKLFVPGARYRLSFHYLREAFASPDPDSPVQSISGFYTRLLVSAAPMTVVGPFDTPQDNVTDTSWQPFSETFTAPFGGDVVVSIKVERGRDLGIAPDWVIFIDDLKLERVLE